MSKQKSITKNYIFNLSYQIFSIIIPLVTAPYISRVLQSDGVGINAFVTSVASYFVLFGAFGFNFYAQREIAKCREDKHDCSIIFFEIVICKFFTTFLTVSINLTLSMLQVYGEYSIYMLIMTITIASPFLDIAFLYRGLEDFGSITIKDIIIKIVGTAAIFIFVRSRDDLWIYILCNCLTTILSSIVLWFGVPKKITKVMFCDLKPFKHYLPAFRLFIPTIAISIYVVLDKSLIGLLIPGTIEQIGQDGTKTIVRIADVENGFYHQAETIVKMPLTIITSLGLVILPRNAHYFKKNQLDLAKSNIYKSFSLTIMIGSAMCFGIAAVALNIVPWFLGPGYDKVSLLIIAFSPIILAIGCNAILGQQYLIPKGDDKKYTIAVVCGAIANLLLNLLLIPLLQSFGALISTVFAELLIFIIEYFLVKKELSFKLMIVVNLKYILYGSIMFAVVFSIQHFFLSQPTIINTLILILIGIVVYSFELLVTKDKTFIFVFNTFKNLFTKKQKYKKLK